MILPDGSLRVMFQKHVRDGADIDSDGLFEVVEAATAYVCCISRIAGEGYGIEGVTALCVSSYRWLCPICPLKHCVNLSRSVGGSGRPSSTQGT